MQTAGELAPSGTLGLKVLKKEWPMDPSVREILHHGLPRRGLEKKVNAWRWKNLPHLMRGLVRLAWARAFKLPHFTGVLYLDVINKQSGERTAYGLAGMRVVTTAGVGYIVDAFQNTVELENMKYHGFGTGSTAEAVGDTALVTELTTEYVSDNTRPTGSQTENGANVYRTVGTLDPDADVNLREHGIFSQAATGGGVLLDRTVYASINLVGATGDTLQATYDFTVTAGS